MAQEDAPDLMHALVAAFAPEPAPVASSDDGQQRRAVASSNQSRQRFWISSELLSTGIM